MNIPALTTIMDRQLKEDRTLYPVRALRYYLDRTIDLRGSRSLLFISFKKGHTTDIRPASLFFRLKQTILLCYKQADQQSFGPSMILGPLRRLRSFIMGFQRTKSCKLVTGQLTIHLKSFWFRFSSFYGFL